MRAPDVLVVNNNLTNGYTADFNDERDQNEMTAFAMEVENLQAKQNMHRQVNQRVRDNSRGGGADGYFDRDEARKSFFSRR